MATKTSDINEEKTRVALMAQDIAYIRDDVSAIKLALQTNYVSRDMFDPVKKIAYGAITLIFGIIVSATGYIVSRGGH